MPIHLVRLFQQGIQTDLSLVGLALGIIGWLAAYGIALAMGLKQKTYAIPIVAVALNFTWEVQSALFWIKKMPVYPTVWEIAFLAAVATDAVIVFTVVRYGRDKQVFPELQRWYYPVLAVTFAGAWLLQGAFVTSFDDIVGFADGYLINLVMSILFVFMYLVRRDASGFAYGLAWAKMLGTLGFSITIHYAGNAYFKGTPIPRHPEIMRFLCIACFLIDSCYIGMLTVARRAPAPASPPATDR
jgi:hypothetical protein